ncbi:MAG: argininosuccinate lyase [Defluviitaleaceae bacterium]|nr:argininosuccinate lyase [Defluviitaleaceae bacterium]
MAAEINEDVHNFNQSIIEDRYLLEVDIMGSITHVIMLSEQEILTEEEAEQILNGLGGILEDLSTGKLEYDYEAEDVHMMVENLLIERIGDVGGKLHTARSRNDQVALDLRLYARSEIIDTMNSLLDLQRVILEVAEKHTETIMPGYTHLQRAQPITLAHHLMAYLEMFSRDESRLHDCFLRTNFSPLGAGALAGTTFPIDRKMVAKQLDFAAPTRNSLDSVSDRDFCIELGSCLAIVAMHLSRFAEELILWCSWEFQFAEMHDSFATSSSIMPQKKNPDVAELVRGKTGKVYGNLMAMLTIMKGLPLAYNKDMQEIKQPLFDSLGEVQESLDIFTPMLQTMKFNKENMRKAAAQGFLNATDCADYLTKKGMAFRTAYRLVGELVNFCIKNRCTLDELPIEEYRAKSPLFERDIYEVISIENCVKNRGIIGGPAAKMVKNTIRLVKSEKFGKGK